MVEATGRDHVLSTGILRREISQGRMLQCWTWLGLEEWVGFRGLERPGAHPGSHKGRELTLPRPVLNQSAWSPSTGRRF